MGEQTFCASSLFEEAIPTEGGAEVPLREAITPSDYNTHRALSRTHRVRLRLGNAKRVTDIFYRRTGGDMVSD
jgi:hypothetical protein